ncbi:MAG TPA: hypothetical protein VL093_02345, partial [Flavipsychrobacter sp.]|nr:hypothetical protein [Flavipsychrobacter sp.]
MALHWPTFFTRLGSAIVFSIIMMAGLLWNEWAFLILTALIQTLCLREYFRLLGRIFPDVVIPSWVHTLTQLFSLALLLIFAYSAISGQATLFPALL